VLNSMPRVPGPMLMLVAPPANTGCNRPSVSKA